MIRKVAFTYYRVTDMAVARGFYEGVLGLASSASEKSPWVEYDLPGGGGFAITNVVPGSPSGSAGGTIAFEVDDIAALTAELTAKAVKMGSTDLTKGPHCRMMPVFDPDGNAVLLHQLD